MKIKVEVKNDILGNSVFWEGDSDDISQIRNIPAQVTAKKVAQDGETRCMNISTNILQIRLLQTTKT